MHTHHTQPKSAEPRKRNIPKVSIRHRDAGISALSQKESGHQLKKTGKRFNQPLLTRTAAAVQIENSKEYQTLENAATPLLHYSITPVPRLLTITSQSLDAKEET